MYAVEFIARTHIDVLPEGHVIEPVGSLAEDQAVVTLIEGWRGEICHVAITGCDGRFVAYKVVDPSFHNWFGLAMGAAQSADFRFPAVQQEFQPLLLRVTISNSR